jgi:hypothetical protein
VTFKEDHLPGCHSVRGKVTFAQLFSSPQYLRTLSNLKIDVTVRMAAFLLRKTVLSMATTTRIWTNIRSQCAVKEPCMI